MRNCNFTGTRRIQDVVFENCNLENANFRKIKLEGYILLIVFWIKRISTRHWWQSAPSTENRQQYARQSLDAYTVWIERCAILIFHPQIFTMRRDLSPSWAIKRPINHEKRFQQQTWGGRKIRHTARNARQNPKNWVLPFVNNLEWLTGFIYKTCQVFTF